MAAYAPPPVLTPVANPGGWTPVAAPMSAPAAYGIPTNPGTRAPGALASLVFGILAFVTFVFGIVFAPLALIFGYKAKRRINESGGRLGGAGMSLAGRVLGFVWLSFIPFIILSAVVFVLVSNVATDENTIVEDSVTIPAGQSYLQGFVLYQRTANVTYSIEAEGIRAMSGGIYEVDDANDPSPTNFDGWAESSGSNLQASAALERGSYALLISCDDAQDCDVSFKLTASTESSSSSTTDTQSAVSFVVAAPATCGEIDAPASGGPNRLPDWRPAVPSGNFAYFDSDSTEWVGLGVVTAYGDDCEFDVTQYGRILRITLQGDPSWDLQFQYAADQDGLKVGTYENVGNHLDDPDEVGMVARTHHVCNDVLSTFIVDEIGHDENGVLSSVTIRFEQHCEGAAAAVLGHVHWSG
jgi:hypothetical protein